MVTLGLFLSNPRFQGDGAFRFPVSKALFIPRADGDDHFTSDPLSALELEERYFGNPIDYDQKSVIYIAKYGACRPEKKLYLLIVLLLFYADVIALFFYQEFTFYRPSIMLFIFESDTWVFH